MPHQVRKHKLGRPTAQRQALFRGLTRSLVLEERIQTTEAKAKAVRPVAERFLALGCRALRAQEAGDTPESRARALHYRRMAFSFIQDNRVVGKVFGELAQRFKERPGGYTRILKVGTRKGDAAPLALLELVE
jgi:large subunit ribosomal protein L17